MPGLDRSPNGKLRTRRADVMVAAEIQLGINQASVIDRPSAWKEKSHDRGDIGAAKVPELITPSSPTRARMSWRTGRARLGVGGLDRQADTGPQMQASRHHLPGGLDRTLTMLRRASGSAAHRGSPGPRAVLQTAGHVDRRIGTSRVD